MCALVELVFFAQEIGIFLYSVCSKYRLDYGSRELQTLFISCPTGFTGLTGFVFDFSPFAEGEEKMESTHSNSDEP